MAKQISSIQLKGRLLNISYYKAKHMKQGVARMTDPNASERAKISPNYAAFRAYGKEFGMTGDYVSKFISGLPYRDQYMLNPNRTADLTKWMIPYLAYDTTDPVGKRNYRGDNIQTAFVQWLQKQVKLSAMDILGTNYEFTVYENLPSQPSQFQFTAWYNEDLVARFRSRGFDGFYYNLYTVIEVFPYFNSVTQNYDKYPCGTVERVAGSWDISSGLDCTITYSIPFTADGNNYTKMVLLILRPYRQTEDGSKLALLEYCTALMGRVRQLPL